MLLINCEINFILTWSSKCVSSNSAKEEPIFVMIDTKLYFLFVTLSNHDSAKLLQRLKSGFKITTS